MVDSQPPESARFEPDSSVDDSSPAPVDECAAERVPIRPRHATDPPAVSHGAAGEPPDEPGRGDAPTQHPDRPSTVRPPRPPVVTERAEIIERTRPGRVQWASERFWTVAVLLGALGFITAWIGHRSAVDALIQLETVEAGEAGRDAAKVLHFIALGIAGAGVLVEALLLAFLRRRGIATRILLTVLAIASVALLQLALEILGQGNWLAVVVKVGLVTHAIGAVVGSVLMWFPIGARRST